MAISKVIYKTDANDSGTVWMDTTDKTVTAGDMLSGKTALKADGTTATGNIATKTSSDLTASGLTITAPAGYYASSASKSASDENLVAGNIKKDVTIFSVTGTYEGSGGGTTEAEEKDVNFIDYDGTIVYSYTAAEFANLSELPANPSHTGLTARGWNWSLSDAQTYVAANGGLWIGQLYYDANGATEIDIVLHQGRLAPYLGLGVNGTVTIDWGDSSTANTVTGTSLTTRIATQHTYSAPGKYTIKITPTSGNFALVGTNNFGILSNNSTGTGSRVYEVVGVRFGQNVAIGSYAFYYCKGLNSIVFPSTISFTSTCTYILYSAQIDSVSMPKNLNIDNISYMFSQSEIKSVSLPSSETTALSANAFYNCQYLSAITIPANITTLKSDSLRNFYGLGEIHFKPTSPPTSSNSNVFGNLLTDCIIYVPYSADHSILNSYTSANNYPDPATYTYMEE